MPKIKTVIVYCLFVLLIHQQLQAQAKDNAAQDSLQAPGDNSEEKKHTFRLALQAGNNLVQNGKKMSKDELYLRPTLYYNHISGFYAISYVSYLPGDKKRPLDNVTADVGYDRDFGDKLTLGVDYMYTYYYSSKQVGSSASNLITLSGSWYNKIITPTLYSIWSVGTTNDYTAGMDFIHTFKYKNVFKTNDVFTIPIIVGAYAGTSNNYQSYTKKNNVTDKKGKAVSTSDINPGFGLTSIFFSAALKYRYKHMAISPAINYYLQFNQPKKLASSNVPVYKLTLSYYF